MSATSTHDAIDAAAEREAEALAWLEENLDEPQPLARLDIERAYVDAALSRGLPIRKPAYKYQRQNSIRAWLKICDRYASGRPGPSEFRFHVNTREERQAWDLRRPTPDSPPIHPSIFARATAALSQLRSGTLAQLDPSTLMDLPRAAKATGLAERTLYRAAAKGILPTVSVLRRIGEPSRFVQVSALRAYVERCALVAS